MEKSRISGLFRNKYLGFRNYKFLHYSQMGLRGQVSPYRFRNYKFLHYSQIRGNVFNLPTKFRNYKFLHYSQILSKSNMIIWFRNYKFLHTQTLSNGLRRLFWLLHCSQTPPNNKSTPFLSILCQIFSKTKIFHTGENLCGKCQQ